MDGVLVVDKPSGVTSHDVVAMARRALRERRIGHTGTLDPLATGVLPLVCGRATRLARFLSAGDKDYEAVIRFGVSTDSYDVTGVETARTGRMPPAADIERAVGSLRGRYDQMPPAYSAKRVGGTRAYELARSAAPVALTPVPVHVARADVLSIAGDTATVAITCSAGFYVRTFAHVLGELTGAGASLSALRRTRSGEFDGAAAVGVDVLMTSPDEAARRLVPIDRLLPWMPSGRLTGEGRRRVAHGRVVEADHVLPPGLPDGVEAPDGGSERWVRLADEDGHLAAIAIADRGRGALHPAVVLI